MNRNPKTLVLPEFSNREDIYLPVGVFDDDTGDPVDMAALGWTFQFEIRRIGPHGSGDDYGPWYDSSSSSPIIRAVLGNGPDAINIVDIGQLLIWIGELNAKKLRHRTYGAALVGTDGSRTFQVFKATLPIDYGGVTN